MINQDRPRI